MAGNNNAPLLQVFHQESHRQPCAFSLVETGLEGNYTGFLVCCLPNMIIKVVCFQCRIFGSKGDVWRLMSSLNDVVDGRTWPENQGPEVCPVCDTAISQLQLALELLAFGG